MVPVPNYLYLIDAGLGDWVGKCEYEYGHVATKFIFLPRPVLYEFFILSGYQEVDVPEKMQNESRLNRLT